MIKKPSKLTVNPDLQAVLSILNEGLMESRPSLHLKKYIQKNQISFSTSKIDLNNFDQKFLVAIGKSAGTMAEHVSKKINFNKGLVIVPKGVKPILKQSIQIINSGHPIPNANSLKAGKRLISFLSKLGNLILYYF